MQQTGQKENKTKAGKWVHSLSYSMCFVFDKFHSFQHNYTLLFTNEWTTVKFRFGIVITFFFRSGKLVPGLVKIVSLPDRMSCKVWRTFVKTGISPDNALYLSQSL